MKKKANKLNERGVTLVELMIVVAIIAVLAAIATVAYNTYVTGAKIERLNQMALELKSGQERFRARNNVYYDAGPYLGNEDNYRNLLDFATTVPDDVTIDSEGWDGSGGTCSICDGAPFDDSVAGYAVRVMKHFKPGGDQTTIVITHASENPIMLHEGE